MRPTRSAQGSNAGNSAGRTHYNGILTAMGADSVTISTIVSGTVTIEVSDASCIQMPRAKTSA